MRGSRLEQPPIPFKTGSLVVLGAIIFLLSFRLDGWGNPDVSVARQLELLPFTLCFIALIALACLGRTELLPLPVRWRKGLNDLSPFRLGLSLAILEQCMAIALFVIEAFYFSRQGYVLRMPWVVAVTALSAIAFVYAAAGPVEARAGRFLLASGAVFTAGVVLSIACFPLTPMRSDMLPLIAAANARFVSGHSPYVRYLIWNGYDYLTYLPLTWMAYLPASLLRIDLRWTNVVLTLSAACITYFSVRPRQRLYASCLLSLFLLLPYVQFRHELYASTQWLIFAIVFAFLQRRRWMAASIILGCGVATSQLFWFVIPFYLLLLFVWRGWKAPVFGLALVLAPAAAFIVPFLAASPREFLFCVLGHWGALGWYGTYLPVRAYNAGFWINYALAHLHMASFRSLQRVQGAALVVLFLMGLRYRSDRQEDLWRWAAAAITLFALTNFLVWPYFYVTAIFALMLSLLCTAEERGTDADVGENRATSNAI